MRAAVENTRVSRICACRLCVGSESRAPPARLPRSPARACRSLLGEEGASPPGADLGAVGRAGRLGARSRGWVFAPDLGSPGFVQRRRSAETGRGRAGVERAHCCFLVGARRGPRERRAERQRVLRQAEAEQPEQLEFRRRTASWAQCPSCPEARSCRRGTPWPALRWARGRGRGRGRPRGPASP